MAKPLPDGMIRRECARAGRTRIAAGVLAAFLCLLCLVPPDSGWAQSVPNADLLQMKGNFLKRIKEDKAAMGRYEELLSRAQAAHEQALSDNDADGASITQQAMENAQRALDAARRTLAGDENRLDAVNHALVLWTSIGDSIGPRALATIARGQITVDTPQGAKAFDPYLPVQPGQHIHLGAHAFLELQLGNGSEMHIGPNSDFEYERDVKGVQWEIFRGELHKVTIIMGVRGANDEARYRGATAVCAVRGTDFTLSTDGNEDTVTVLEGAVEVDPGGGRTKQMLGGGQELIVPKAGAVAPATTFDSNAIARWWER